ncbi:hypothetical protein AAMO2058_000973700 [Amorphochlora amoebiformis]
MRTEALIRRRPPRIQRLRIFLLAGSLMAFCSTFYVVATAIQTPYNHSLRADLVGNVQENGMAAVPALDSLPVPGAKVAANSHVGQVSPSYSVYTPQVHPKPQCSRLEIPSLPQRATTGPNDIQLVCNYESGAASPGNVVNFDEYQRLKKRYRTLEKVVQSFPMLKRDLRVRLADEELGSDALETLLPGPQASAPVAKRAPKSAGRTPFPNIRPVSSFDGVSSPSMLRIMESHPPSRSSRPRSSGSWKRGDQSFGDTECESEGSIFSPEDNANDKKMKLGKNGQLLPASAGRTPCPFGMKPADDDGDGEIAPQRVLAPNSPLGIEEAALEKIRAMKRTSDRLEARSSSKPAPTKRVRVSPTPSETSGDIMTKQDDDDDEIVSAPVYHVNGKSVGRTPYPGASLPDEEVMDQSTGSTPPNQMYHVNGKSVGRTPYPGASLPDDEAMDQSAGSTPPNQEFSVHSSSLPIKEHRYLPYPQDDKQGTPHVPSSAGHTPYPHSYLHKSHNNRKLAHRPNPTNNNHVSQSQNTYAAYPPPPALATAVFAGQNSHGVKISQPQSQGAFPGFRAGSAGHSPFPGRRPTDTELYAAASTQIPKNRGKSLPSSAGHTPFPGRRPVSDIGSSVFQASDQSSRIISGTQTPISGRPNSAGHTPYPHQMRANALTNDGKNSSSIPNYAPQTPGATGDGDGRTTPHALAMGEVLTSPGLDTPQFVSTENPTAATDADSQKSRIIHPPNWPMVMGRRSSNFDIQSQEKSESASFSTGIVSGLGSLGSVWEDNYSGAKRLLNQISFRIGDMYDSMVKRGVGGLASRRHGHHWRQRSTAGNVRRHSHSSNVHR